MLVCIDYVQKGVEIVIYRKIKVIITVKLTDNWINPEIIFYYGEFATTHGYKMLMAKGINM